MCEGRLPTFLCIGAPRTGTTWLCEALQAHPEAFVPSIKEACFFIRDDFRSTWSRGLGWYRGLFDFPDDERIKAWGELSPRYYFLEQTPGLIRETVPDVKIIYLLRHPVEVLYSLAQYHLKMYPAVINGHRYGLADYLDHHLVGPLGFYARYLKRFAAHFPREQILVRFYEDLKRDAADNFARICDFLGIDPRIIPPAVHEQINPALVPRRFAVSVLMDTLSRRCWRGFARLDERYNRIEAKKAYSREASVTPEIFNTLMDIYRPDIHDLESLVDRDLSYWFEYENLHSGMRSTGAGTANEQG